MLHKSYLNEFSILLSIPLPVSIFRVSRRHGKKFVTSMNVVGSCSLEGCFLG